MVQIEIEVKDPNGDNSTSPAGSPAPPAGGGGTPPGGGRGSGTVAGGGGGGSGGGGSNPSPAGGGRWNSPATRRTYQAQNRLRRMQRSSAARQTAQTAAVRAARQVQLAAQRAAKQQAKVAAQANRDRERATNAQRQRVATIAGAAIQGAAGVAGGKAGAGQVAGGAVGAVAGEIAGAALGGPIGAAIGQVVGKEIGEKIGRKIDDPIHQVTDALNTFTKVAQVAGRVLGHVAGGDGIGAFATATTAAADALDDVPVAGKSMAASIRAVTTGITVLNQVVGAFAERGRQLSGYDGRIAVAAAQQDVTRLLSDIREAQRMGEGYAALLQKQSELDETIKAGLIPIKEIVVGVLPKAIDMFLDAQIKLLANTDRLIPGKTILGEMVEEMRKTRTDMANSRLEAPSGMINRWLGRGDAPGEIVGVPKVDPDMGVPLIGMP